MIEFRQPTVLFGGSFDPVHEGHLHVAREVLRQLPEVKQFVFVPAAHSPGKLESFASADQRLAWLRLAVAPEGYSVWDREVSRKGESYTVDTLEEAHRLGAQTNQLYWLLGADSYAGFAGWKNPARIRELCRLLVADRPGHEVSPQDPADQFISIPPHPASSTEIRARLAAGETAPAWLPRPVKGALTKLLPVHNPYARKNR